MPELYDSDVQSMSDSEGPVLPLTPNSHSQDVLRASLTDTLEYKSEKLEPRQGSSKDVIIVLILGTLGAGKSSFIDRVTENTDRAVGHDLNSGTKEVTLIEGYATDGSCVDLVDTPGLDGERQSTIAILGEVSIRLNEKYGIGTKPSIILYFQPILNDHVVGRPQKVIEVLQGLWGKDAMSKVFFVTTMWDEVKDPEDGEERLTELEGRGAILQGYTILRHLDTRDSAMQLLDAVVQWARKLAEVQLQREAEDMDRAGIRDIIIALVGPTGTGKSSFIDKVTGDAGESVGHSLTSCTSEIGVTRYAIEGFNVVLADTPGYNDTKQSELEVPEMILNWLDSTYETRPILSAILYFYRISDNRVPSTTPMKILRDFQKLCGGNDMSRVALVTTMWDEEEDDVGEEKLKELEETYWKMMILRGSTTFKYLNTQDSAMQLLRSIVRRTVEREELRLREGISSMKSELWETTAGRELCSRLEELEARRKEILRRILAEGERADQKTAQGFWKEFAQVRTQLDTALTEAQTLRRTRIRMAWIRFIFARVLARHWGRK